MDPQPIPHSHHQLLEEYLKSLTEKEYKAYEIAKSHLGTSFDLKKSNGYLDWLKKQPQSHQS